VLRRSRNATTSALILSGGGVGDSVLPADIAVEPTGGGWSISVDDPSRHRSIEVTIDESGSLSSYLDKQQRTTLEATPL